jgi:hypothetical protein
MKNQRLRLMAKGSGVALWEIADYLKISEATLTRRLRTKLTEEREKEITDAIIIIKDRKAKDAI